MHTEIRPLDDATFEGAPRAQRGALVVDFWTARTAPSARVARVFGGHEGRRDA